MFCCYWTGSLRGLSRGLRRRRQMCIRDGIVQGFGGCENVVGGGVSGGRAGGLAVAASAHHGSQNPVGAVRTTGVTTGNRTGPERGAGAAEGHASLTGGRKEPGSQDFDFGGFSVRRVLRVQTRVGSINRYDRTLRPAQPRAAPPRVGRCTWYHLFRDRCVTAVRCRWRPALCTASRPCCLRWCLRSTTDWSRPGV